MADIENDLSRELTRVISCPYPASLTRLGDIVQRASDRMIIRAILDRPPCAILKLASLVSAALPLWAYTLPLLQSLCRSPEFTDQLLLHNPDLLHALLTKTNASRREFDEYAQLCVLLLSRPLPEHVVLPVSAQAFFLRMFKEATEAPDVASLKPIYRMLNGACRDLLSLLSSDARQDFDKRLCQILSSNSTGQNSMLLLWCFGIVLLAEHPHEVGEINPRPEPTNLDRQWKTASGKKLFGSASGVYKTINLTYLSVIWATKGDVGVSDSEAAEGIRIGIRAMHFVAQDVRKAWPSSSQLAASIFPKLPAKILRKDIDAGVQLEAIAFYAMIADERSFPRDIVTLFEALLLAVGSLSIGASTLHEILHVALPLFSENLQETTVHGLLARLLRVGTSPTNPSELLGLTILTEELIIVIRHSASIRSQILLALSHLDLQPNLKSFLGPGNNQAQPMTTGPPCETSTSHLSQKLMTSVLSMILTAALAARSTEPALPQQLTLDLMNKQQQLSRSKVECSHPASNFSVPVSIFEEKCTQSVTTQRDWRERLASDIEMQSYYQRDSLIRSVAQICQDLESRCENVEEPLRAEQAKVQELTTLVQQLRDQIHSFETESVDRRMYIDGLEADVEHISSEKEEVSSNLEILRAELADANEQAELMLHAAYEDFNAKQSDFRSILLEHEEELHARSKEVEDQEATIARLEEKLREVIEARDTSEGLHKISRAKLNDTEHNLETKTVEVSAHVEQIRRLTDDRTSLEQRLMSEEQNVRTLHAKLEALEAQHKELVRSSDEALQALTAEHDHQTRIAIAKSDDQYAQLNGELQEALHNEQQAKDVYEDLRQELHIAQTSITTLESKIQQLTSLCSDKDVELRELRTLRSRVLASMGLATESSLPIRSSNQASDQISPKEHRRRKSSAPQSATAPNSVRETQGVTNTAMEDLANASFTSSESSSRHGSTPKRAKPRSSFKVPLVSRTPHKQKPPHPSKSISKLLSPSKRPALKALSPNRRHTTVGFAFPGRQDYDKEDDGQKRRGSIYSVDQASFDMDELVSGTPFTPGNFVSGTSREPDEGEGTTEL